MFQKKTNLINDNSNSKLICKCCNGSHDTRFCPSTICSVCKENFQTPKLRAKHYFLEHNSTVTSNNNSKH